VSLQVKQINRHLSETYFKHIDVSDLKASTSKDEIATTKRIRSLVALSVNMLAEASIEVACASVTDGYDDNGIDGIYYSNKDRILYLIQSKYHYDGKGSIEVGDVHKFLQGVSDLIQAKFDKFNKKIKSRKTELMDKLLDAQNKFNLVIVYSGKDKISSHCMDPLNDFLNKNNEISEPFYLTSIDVKDIHAFISSGAGHKPIDVDVAIHNWGYVQDPIKAIYGQVAGSDVAHWYRESGPHIFSPNIRVYLGNTEVNEGITDTVRETAELFWYFNNGITAICRHISKKPIGGDSRDTEYFECKNIKIVNGAQTVGTLQSLLSKYDKNLASTRIWIRIIEVEQDDDQLSRKITRTNNTQNRIEKRDFVALDPQQKRIHDELMLENVIYLYKSGETSDDAHESFDLTDAMVARACVQKDVQHCVQAKREISKLWEDIEKPPYKLLFNGSVRGPQLYREVLILRSVDGYVTTKKQKVSDRDQLLVTHGNRFLLHLVYSHFGDDIYSRSFDISKTGKVCESCFVKLRKAVNSLYPDSYLATLFKNLTKCKEVKKEID
jgi:hypothetical protein